MNLIDFFIIVVILAVIGGAAYYIVKEKRRGVQCIGCPAAGECAKKKKGSCSGQKNQ